MDDDVEILKGTVALLYDKAGMRAFRVKCDVGTFVVVDYVCDPLDREVYWERDTKLVRPGCDEYDMPSALIRGYVNTIHNKLKPSQREKWPKLK